MEKNIKNRITSSRLIMMLVPRILRPGVTWVILLGAVLFISQKEMDVRFNFNTADIIPMATGESSSGDSSGGFSSAAVVVKASTDSEKGKPTMPAVNTSMFAAVPTSTPQHNLGNTYSNMTYHTKSRKNQTSKRQKQEAYVKRFASLARAEMNKYGIPASITLAQGLIESNAGESRLSRENNNHFGMKCFSRTCKKGHCSNFTDDSHKDFFRKYNTEWESYRAHSKMLQGKRYRGLKRHGKNYKQWAKGLKNAGYATDPRYAQKLIHIIEELNLAQYDR